MAEDGMPVNGDSSTSEEEYLEQHQNVETPLETQPETETEEIDAEKNWKALREKAEFLEKQLQQLLSAHRWRAKIFDMLIGVMICQILSWVMQMLSSGH